MRGSGRAEEEELLAEHETKAPEVGADAPPRRGEESETAPSPAPEEVSAAGRPREILVCLDRSVRGERSLEHAAALAQRFGSRLTLLHVLEQPLRPSGAPAFSPPDPLEWEILRADSKSYLERLRRRLLEQGIEANARLVEGHAPTRIVREARETGADLVVLASHGAHGPTCWALGHTAQTVAARVSASLMLVPTYHAAPEAETETALRRILVPLDGSRRAECVLPLVTELGREPRAQVRLLHVVRPPEAFSLTYLTSEERDLAARLEQRCSVLAARYLERIVERLEDAGVSARAFVERDRDVRDAITAWARRGDLDLVVMAAHGATGNRCEPRGSIAQHLLTRGTIPMLVVQDVPPEEGRWDLEHASDEHARRPTELYPRERP